MLDNVVMLAVDYRLPDGLSWQELEVVLSAACASPGAIGIDVTIYNPPSIPTARSHAGSSSASRQP